MNKRIALIGLMATSALLMHTQVRAESAEKVTPEAEYAPMELTINGGVLTQSPLDKTIVPTLTINGNLLRETGKNDLGGALAQRAPSVFLNTNGGPQQSSSLVMRGVTGKHVLILVDGKKVGSSTLGYGNLNQIPLALVERVEVSTGASQYHYGSAAVGGVINIITKQAGVSGKTTVSAKYGSNNTVESSAVTVQDRVSAGFVRESSDGFNVTQPSKQWDGSVYSEPDDDGYAYNTFYGNLSLYQSDAFNLGATALFREGSVDYDGSYSNKATGETGLFSVDAGGMLSDTFTYSASLYRSKDNSRNSHTDNPYGDSKFETVRDAAVLSVLQQMDPFSFSLGAEWLKDDVGNSSTKYDNSTNTNRALFGSVAVDLSDTTTANVTSRADKNSQFGTHYSWGAGITTSMDTENVANAVYFNYSTPYRAPNMNELYYPGSSNSELKPEEAKAYEVGYNGSAYIGDNGYLTNKVSAYYTEFENLIQADPNNNWTPSNVAKAKIKGIEYAVEYIQSEWELYGNYAFTSAKDSDDKTLIYRPKHNAGAGISYNLASSEIGYSYKYVGQRVDSKGDTLGGYSTSGLFVKVTPVDAFNVTFSLDNLFDKTVEHNKGYNSPGRTFTVGADYSF